MRLLHAIHDFLPRHRAGSEIYAFELAREQSRSHDVFVVCAEYDPGTPHGTLRWRAYGGLTVIELVNNWEFERFEESYRSPRINAQLRHVLEATRPDVLHVHNLLNLSFDLPRIARERGIPSVATLHDYTLVCASGGQRVHVAEAHVCDVIDVERCSRCFGESPFHAQMAAGRVLRRASGLAGPVRRSLVRTRAERYGETSTELEERSRGVGGRPAAFVRRKWRRIAAAAAGAMEGGPVSSGDISRRIAYARHVFDMVDLFVAPSAAIAREFERLGLDPRRVRVSDYGFRNSGSAASAFRRKHHNGPLHIGFVGTLVWHKGPHVLLEAVRGLRASFQVEIHGDPAIFPDYSANLRRLAEGLPVRFAGGFDRDRIADVYGSLDVLVVPSLWPENSPLVIHEAFMHGVAVVASRQGGIPELVTDHVNGLLYDASSVSALRSALQRLIDDPALARRLSLAAPRVKDISIDAREWEERYAEVLDRRRSAAALGEPAAPQP